MLGAAGGCEGLYLKGHHGGDVLYPLRHDVPITVATRAAACS